ncbi:hypothetical protein AAWM_04785 [Aspergillus awamori]|uniref:Contig An18c0040, genomic contig n=6 Tax=Aspergillus TaxID=5052 RepID=E2PT02_ASPNC|nr:uncharacterized protein An18g01000 [Aspergillus niger]XP_025453864.1 uncharacterized protein BO96DRAFT_412883 [Aspergillus niger CBS 101883]XP_026627746.1 hypothetical protein BDQ94DRAFT_140797 [Aspergillus welwitschiae]RDH24915.1 hypothetical protein M747DRAFT_292597 [Aspergillus niger ATCC 13496]RDK42724.1 hypothetical protein M752DRAFT_292903 [Aspergillus phoenicis ATCC 13157]GCB21900.1 hypothetical protein AAWM_04785 [Aspergillus awamori]KAI2824986.1 hypothetical protein CBS115989_407 |eukprot:XP_001398564.1 hypothetical protein ANI_1_110164 [Aspergillus niger CBS 513.88]
MYSYEKVNRDDDSDQGLLAEDSERVAPQPRVSRFPSWTNALLLLGLLFSLSLNVGWFVFQKGHNVPIQDLDPDAAMAKQRSPYTGLAWDTHKPYSHHSEYTSENATHADEMWESLSMDPMVIAPTWEWAQSKGLSDSWAFPWDSNRRIYFIKVFHQLHCLKLMRHSYHELWSGQESSIPAPHIEHCLDSLRQDLMCKADDTPMPSLQLLNGGGEGQQMQCKDFDKLVAWSKAPERNACYKRLTDYKPIVHSIERYAFCPEDSEHYPTMSKYFEEHGHYADPFSE